MTSQIDKTKVPTRAQIKAARGVEVHAPSLVIALKDAATDAPTWIQVAKQGSFRGHVSGAFEMTLATFEQIVSNFRAQENKFIPLDFEHASEQHPSTGSIPHTGAPAQGWIVDLQIRSDGTLWGLCDWGDLARQYVREKKYRYLSPAIVFGSKDRVTGKSIGARLSSVALTNGPFLDGLAPLTAKHEEPAGRELKKSLLESQSENKLEDSESCPVCTIMSEALATKDEELATLTARIADLESHPVTVTAKTDEDATTLTARVADLEQQIRMRDDADADRDVAMAMSVWGVSRSLTSSMRPALLSHRKMDPEGFRAVYPPLAPGVAPMASAGRLVAAGPHHIEQPILASAYEGGATLATTKLPTVTALAHRLMKEAEDAGRLPKMSREEAFSRATNSSFYRQLCGDREIATVDCLEVDDGSVTPEVEDILSTTDIARAATLLSGDVGERVLHLHPFA